MGSNFSSQMCCVICGRCKKREAEGANEETSETKPILQSSGERSGFPDTQPPTPALKVPRPGSKDVQSLSQARWPSVDTLEESTETCPAADPMGRAEGWEPTWNPMDFFVVPADEEAEVEAQDKQQEKMGNTEVQIQPVPHVPEAQPVGHTARGAELVAEEEQPKKQAEPGSEGALCAGITLQEKNILDLLETGNEAPPGQDCEMGPPADTGEVVIGKDLSLCAVQMEEKTEPCLSAEHVGGMDGAKLAEISPQSPQRSELTCLLEAMSLLTVQNPPEVTASGVAGLYSASAVSWGSLCPEWGSLEPENQLLDLLKPETLSNVPPAQGMGSLPCAEPVGLSELLHQPSHGVPCQLENEGSRELDAGPVAGEAELQHRTMQQTLELPQEPATCVPVPVKQEAQFPGVPPSLFEVLESSGETEVENVEA